MWHLLMRRCVRSPFVLVILGHVAFGCSIHASEPTPSAVPDVYFETEVRQILKAHCFHCHGEEQELKGKLDLRLVRLMVQGGENGTALVPGDPSQSSLWQRIESGEMPPTGKGLSEKEKATLRDWIIRGAKTRREEPASLPTGNSWTPEELSYWAFQPVQRPSLPIVTSPTLVNNPIDLFLLSRLESQGLSFASPASAISLLRRVSFDLRGSPPTLEEVASLEADSSPERLQQLIDKMLASPQLGENWARHWLDPVGYADSDGYTETDAERPWAFRYRDYVIRAFNDNKPLNQFLIEQLAGDELLTPPYQDLSDEDADKLIATGFLRMVPDGTSEGAVDANVARNDLIADTIKVLSSTLYGMTVGCAQCHNHRYDPISQEDYYRIRAILEPSLDWKNWRDKNSRLVSLWKEPDRQAAASVDQKLAELEGKRVAELDGIVNEVFEKEVAKLPPEKQTVAKEARSTAQDKRTPEHLALMKEHPSLNVDRGSVYLYEQQRLQEFNKRYEQLQTELKAQRPPERFVSCLTEVPGSIPETKLFYRGDFQNPRDTVPPNDLSVLPSSPSIPSDDPALPTSGRRLAYARWLTSGKHPLVARVLVNRVWMHFFGRGIVASPSDFGQLGERPSHPELLDWLADELVQSGWDLKHIQRLIVSSYAYQQASHGSPENLAADPENRLLGRMPLRRLTAENIRDAMLEVAGLTVHTMYGTPSPVNPDETGQIIVGTATRDGNGILVAKFEESPIQYRRSIYMQVRRSMPLGITEPFDPPQLNPNCERRNNSTVAPQALVMMNNRMSVHFAEKFADRLIRVAGPDPVNQTQLAWKIAFGDLPTEQQTSTTLAYLNEQRQHFQNNLAAISTAAAGTPEAETAITRNSLAILCQALIASNRFLYLD